MMKVGDEVQVVEKVDRNILRFLWTGIVQEIITDPDRARYALGEPPIYMVDFSTEYKKVHILEPFTEDELGLHNPLTREEIEGKWLWGHQTKIFVEKKDEEDNFYIIHEPGSPWGPRPVHFDNLKYHKIIDESFQPAKVEGEAGINGPGFCSCHAYKADKKYASIKMAVNVNRWDLEKAIKPIQDLLLLKGIRVETRAFLGKTTLKFIDMWENHESKTCPTEN